MKKLFLVSAVLLLTACNNGQKINAHSEKTAYKSVQMIKLRLPENTRIEYETSFWMTRDEQKNDAEFLKTIDGKTPAELVAMGKGIYEQRKTAGIAEYQQYQTWEEMIAKHQQERVKQGEPETDIKKDSKNNRDINYKL